MTSGKSVCFSNRPPLSPVVSFVITVECQLGIIYGGNCSGKIEFLDVEMGLIEVSCRQPGFPLLVL